MPVINPSCHTPENKKRDATHSLSRTDVRKHHLMIRFLYLFSNYKRSFELRFNRAVFIVFVTMTSKNIYITQTHFFLYLTDSLRCPVRAEIY